LLEAIAQALDRDYVARERRAKLSELHTRFALLTTREREVTALIVTGSLNKQVAAELGVSEITIKVHRRHIMEKMQVRSLAQLVLLVERLS
jgi:FixJ family two-component response regulator